MRVIGYLQSSFWTMRGDEFATMMRRAHAHADQLDSILSEGERHKPDAMLAKTGTRMDGTRYVQVRDGVAVIDLNGVIAKRMNLFEEMCFGGASTEILIRDFAAAVDSPNVESIVLHIDSPGGEAFGINEFAQAVYDARGKKPIKAYISGLGCSGAYWIASAAEEVILDKSAFVGSIGVVTAWMDDKEFYKMMGIRREVVTSSNAPFKRLDFDNDEHRAELQRELDSLESVFIKAVARNRKVTVEQVKKDFNQGGVLAGADAVKAGMADRVGSLEDVLRSLKARKRQNGTAQAAAEGDVDMGFKDDFKAFAQKLGFEVKDSQAPEPDESTPVGDQPEPEDQGTDNAATGQETAPETKPETPAEEPASTDDVEAIRAELFSTKADAFVESEVKAGRLYPAETQTFKSLFMQALNDDLRSPLAEGSRVETLKANQQARKPHGLTTEVIGAGGDAVVLGTDSTEKTKLDKDVESQVDSYVATVQPGAKKLEAVK